MTAYPIALGRLEVEKLHLLVHLSQKNILIYQVAIQEPSTEARN